jgi:hypothetical protein
MINVLLVLSIPALLALGAGLVVITRDVYVGE